MADDELDSYYDLCINGTGLIESIVACAVSKAGLKVLHLDKNDFYGSNYSSFNYDSWLEFGSSKTDGFNVIIDSSSTQKTENDTSIERGSLREIAIQKSRSFNIDLKTKLLLCSSLSVEFMINAGISNYLEFKSIEAIYYVSSSNSDNILTVPCSKNDVFNSKLLNAYEKRILTKFLQFANDYGRESKGESAFTVNEIELGSGRSLIRPQNKTFNSSGYSLADFEFKTFVSFLINCKVPESLRVIIIHALCLQMHSTDNSSDSLTTRSALLKLYAFLNSLGKYSETSLLTTIYGTSEMVQAFCRMCAVWGGVYVLRRCITQIHIYDSRLEGTLMRTIKRSESCVNENENEDVDNTSSTAAKNPVTESLPKRLLIQDDVGNTFACNALLSGIENYSSAAFAVKSMLLTRVSICNSACLPLSKSLLIIPPKTAHLNNPNAIFVTQLDSTTMVCVNDFFQLNIATQFDIDDDKTVLYQNINGKSEDWTKFVDESSEELNIFMNKVISWLKALNNERDTDIVFIEIDHVNYVRPLFSFDEDSGTVHPSHDVLPNSVYICGETSQNYTVSLDDCMNQAKTIFHKMFPNIEFMLDATDKEEDESTRFSSELEEISYFKSALSLSCTQSVVESTDEVIYVKMINKSDT